MANPGVVSPLELISPQQVTHLSLVCALLLPLTRQQIEGTDGF